MILGLFLTIRVTFMATLTLSNKDRQKVYNHLQRQDKMHKRDLQYYNKNNISI